MTECVKDKSCLNRNKVAVILVNFNGLTDSVECIESIRKMDDLSRVNVIVVDNASAVNEAAIIQEKFPEIIALRSEKNRGFSAGNNMGIRYALENDYGYVLLLNNDTVVSPDLINLLLEYCSDEAIAVPKMLYFNRPNVIWYAGGEINRFIGNGVHTLKNCEDNRDTEIRACSFATGCCMLIKKSVLERVGLFEESYFMYFEDTEYCIRLSDCGIRINYVPSAKLWHKVSKSTGGSDSPYCSYYLTRNRLTCIKEHKKYFSAMAYIFALITRVVRMIQMDDKECRRALREGIGDHLKGLSGPKW